MKDNRSLNSSTQSVVSPPTSTLQQLKEIAALFHSGSCSNEVRRIARAVCLTVGLRGKLTGSVISSFLDRPLLPGSEAHTRLSCFVKTDEHHMEVDTSSSSSQAPPKYFKHLHAEVELYCYLIVLLFLIDQKKYNEAKVCSVSTIGRLKSVNRRTFAVIAAKLNVYYYLRYEKPDDLVEIRSTVLPLHQLTTLKK